MLKKLATLVCAVAFSLAAYSPAADACPGKDSKVVKKEKKEQDGKKVAEDDKKSDDKKSDEKKSKKKTEKEDGKKVSRK